MFLSRHERYGDFKQGDCVAPEGERAATEGMAKLLRSAAAEGAVLLKNDGTLPLHGQIAIYGRAQTNTFYTGYGSGGAVLKPYRVSILDGLERAGMQIFEPLSKMYRIFARDHALPLSHWGKWPFSVPEMPLSEDFISACARIVDTAIVVIGRAAGEDREAALKKGSYYLTDDEANLMELATKYHKHVVVVLNVGNIIDMSWVNRYNKRISALLLVWQGGMEAGNAVADLLSGAVTPSGKLPDTVATEYEKYPSAYYFGGKKSNEYVEDIYVGYRFFESFERGDVLFPFGYGLSYTKFELASSLKEEEGGGITVHWKVKNIGTRLGKEVVEVYLKKPCGKFGNPLRELVGFYKTRELAPGEAEEGDIPLEEGALASYDEELSAYVVEEGEYSIYVGTDVRSAARIGSVRREEKVYLQLSEQGAPKKPFDRLVAVPSDGVRAMDFAPVRTAKSSLKEKVKANLPAEFPSSQAESGTLADVESGKMTLEAFVASLSLEELEALSRGDFGMNSPLGAKGNAGVFGGIMPSLREKGIPPVTATDGPSGIRLATASSLLPIGTLLAATFSTELVEEVYAAVGGEMLARGSDVLLAPAMNLHRNPLCGRNFEYFSEDPYLTGKIAAAAVRGLQKKGVSACPKHFACNNQETGRKSYDSRLSERALREIYLKGFEICVKEGKPQNMMAASNKVNGVGACYHYELCRGILRGEWGYEGNVLTDWWVRGAHSREFKGMKKSAYRIRAGVNVEMPGSSRGGSDGSVKKSLKSKDGLTLGELQRNAAEILRFILHSSARKK